MDEMTMKNLRSLSSSEVAALMGVDRHTVNAWQEAGELPFFVVGNKRRTLETDVRKFIDNGGCALNLRQLRQKAKS